MPVFECTCHCHDAGILCIYGPDDENPTCACGTEVQGEIRTGADGTIWVRVEDPDAVFMERRKGDELTISVENKNIIAPSLNVFAEMFQGKPVED